MMEKIREILKENLAAPEVVDAMADDGDLTQIEINSITSIKIIVALEDTFQIEFDNDMLDLQNFHTICDLTKYIEAKVGQNERTSMQE